MSKQTWLRDTYPMSYEKAIEDAANGTRQLYFDERYWSKADVKTFLEDLCYGDNATYESVVFTLPKRLVCHNKSEKRFEKWLNDYEHTLLSMATVIPHESS